MTILDRTTCLGNQIERLQKLKSASIVADALAERTRELGRYREALAAKLVQAKVLSDGEVLDRSSLPSIDDLKETLSGVIEQVREDPTEITKGNRYKKLLTGLEALAKSVEQTNAVSWKAYSRLENPVDPGFLALVESVPGYEDRVKMIRGIMVSLRESSASIPMSREELEEVDGLVVRLSRERTLLNPEGWPQAVREFVQQAQETAGVPLDKLSDEVSEWLKDNNLLDHVRLVLRGSGQ